MNISFRKAFFEIWAFFEQRRIPIMRYADTERVDINATGIVFYSTIYTVVAKKRKTAL